MPLLTVPDNASKIGAAGAFLTGIGATVALLYFGRAFCITLVVSVILAFILDPFVAGFMRMRLPRPVASFVVCTMALLLVYLIGVGLFTQMLNLADELPTYSARINVLVDSVAERLERAEEDAYRVLIPKRFQENVEGKAEPDPKPRRRRRNEPPPPPSPEQIPEVRIRQDRPPLVNYLYSYVSSLYHVMLMASFVPFLVYFMLSWREHIRNSFLSIFEGSDRIIAGRSWTSIAEMARAYVVGNFILGLLISIASCICFWSWHLPYWILVGFFSGFLSLVPYIGLPLAMIPPLAAALMTYSTVGPFLFIGASVAFLHLLALNLFYPWVVGARVHLNPLAVTVALMFWGTIWGALGLILAIPITAGAKAVFDNVEGLKAYGRLLGD